MSDPEHIKQSPFYLHKLFGDTVQIRVIEALLKLLIAEESDIEEPLHWLNISELGRAADCSKSAAKQVLDDLLGRDFVVEKAIETHAQTPPRYFRINQAHPAIRDLVFFYTKARGSL